MDFKTALGFGIVFVWLAFCFWFGHKDEQDRKNRIHDEVLLDVIKRRYADKKYDREILADALAYDKSHRDEVNQYKLGGYDDLASKLIKDSIIRRLMSGHYHTSRGCLNDKGEELLAWYKKEMEPKPWDGQATREELEREMSSVISKIREIG